MIFSIHQKLKRLSVNIIEKTSDYFLIDDVVEIKIHRLLDWIIGHDWGEWSKPKEGHWISISESCARECSRCLKRDYREWTEEEKVQMRKNWAASAKAVSKGKIGEISGVRFVESN